MNKKALRKALLTSLAVIGSAGIVLAINYIFPPPYGIVALVTILIGFLTYAWYKMYEIDS